MNRFRCTVQTVIEVDAWDEDDLPDVLEDHFGSEGTVNVLSIDVVRTDLVYND